MQLDMNNPLFHRLSSTVEEFTVLEEGSEVVKIGKSTGITLDKFNAIPSSLRFLIRQERRQRIIM